MVRALVVLDGSLIKRVDICEDYINLVSLNPKYDDIKVASFSDIKSNGQSCIVINNVYLAL